MGKISKKGSVGQHYTIPMIDLSVMPEGLDSKFASLYQQNIIDDATNYMAHPDAVLLKSGSLMCMYPEGHGKGNVVVKTSLDKGITWSDRRTDTPSSWRNSRETPTVYRLEFKDGSEKIVMISGNPPWGVPFAGDGFNASYSNDDGKTWTEFEKFYGKGSAKHIKPMVSMASLTRLKDDKGNWADKWMGVCHDSMFRNYKTILTFENSKMCWSKPERYFTKYRSIEYAVAMCEVEIIRSEQGQGNQLCLIARANGHNRNKSHNSIISFSNDEGKTWSEPFEAPAALSGERHKADWLKDGRLFITFRSINRAAEKLAISREKNGKGIGRWYSEGWVAWVGTYQDLVEGKEGQYRIKLAHTFLSPDVKEPELATNGDCGYCGNAVFEDGTVFTSTYGTFGATYDKPQDTNSKNIISGNKVVGGEKALKTYIVGKTLDMSLLDELYNKAIEKQK